MIRLLVILTSVVLLQACATNSQPTLKLEDVPVLYNAPALENKTLPAVVEDVKSTLTTGSEIDSPKVIENDSPEVVENHIDSSQTNVCSEIASEIDEISTGLGSSAIEEPPNTAWPTVAERAGSFLYNLASQTVLGVVQPVIQTKRAIFNDDEKEKRLAESVERGQIRRAYLIGFAQASGCDQPVDVVVEAAE